MGSKTKLKEHLKARPLIIGIVLLLMYPVIALAMLKLGIAPPFFALIAFFLYYAGYLISILSFFGGIVGFKLKSINLFELLLLLVSSITYIVFSGFFIGSMQAL